MFRRVTDDILRKVELWISKLGKLLRVIARVLKFQSISIGLSDPGCRALNCMLGLAQCVRSRSKIMSSPST
jgi:hypothetical protein